MATSTRFSVVARNAKVDAVTALIGAGGRLKIYSGAQPSSPDAALSGQTLLADLALSATPFAPASNGVAIANAITQDSSADNTGTAAWFSVQKSDGTRIFEGSVGTSDANLILSSLAIVAGGVVSVASLTYTEFLEAD